MCEGFRDDFPKKGWFQLIFWLVWVLMNIYLRILLQNERRDKMETRGREDFTVTGFRRAHPAKHNNDLFC